MKRKVFKLECLVFDDKGVAIDKIKADLDQTFTILKVKYNAKQKNLFKKL
jgi:hypothetical protein